MTLKQYISLLKLRLNNNKISLKTIDKTEIGMVEKLEINIFMLEKTIRDLETIKEIK